MGSLRIPLDVEGDKYTWAFRLTDVRALPGPMGRRPPPPVE